MQAASVPQKLQASVLRYMEKEEQANISKEPIQKGHGTVTLLFMWYSNCGSIMCVQHSVQSKLLLMDLKNRTIKYSVR